MIKKFTFIKGLLLWAFFISSPLLKAIPEGKNHKDFMGRFDKEIYPFYQSAIKGEILGKDNNKLSYIYFRNKKAKKVLVIVPGMSEQAAKYSEVAYDLREDFEIFIFDHRNQGASERLTKIKEMTHVNKFSDYVDDFELFVNKIVKKNLGGRHAYVLAHSMGGMITSLYLSRPNQIFKKAALNSPMHQIRHYGVPAKFLSYILSFFSPENFILTAGPYNWNRKFSTSVVTSSYPRWMMKREIVKREKSLAGGGVSNNWFIESLKITQKDFITNLAKRIKIPVLVFNAGKDLLVSKEGQENFCENVNSRCELIVVEGALHEILQEKDSMRNIVIGKVRKFFR